jgi:DNA-binding NarL/FixJ family response regulator
LARLLADAGFEIVGQAGDADELEASVERELPDMAIIDIRMPPTYTDEGLAAAQAIQQRHPNVGVLVLSQYLDVTYALKLIKDDARGVGYLLKDRIANIEQLTTTLERLADGESVVDPGIVEELLSTRRVQDPLAELTARELEVLALLAEGRTDRGIARQLFITPKTVEAHVRSIFRKLRLPTDPAENRRVHAVLTFLREQPRPDA